MLKLLWKDELIQNFLYFLKGKSKIYARDRIPIIKLIYTDAEIMKLGYAILYKRFKSSKNNRGRREPAILDLEVGSQDKRQNLFDEWLYRNKKS